MLELIEGGLWHNNPLRSALQLAARQLRGQTDHYLLHEYLEAINTPCYFLEFAAAAQQAGLAYVTDAEPQVTFPSTFGAAVAVGLNGLSVNAGREMREQYLDFAVGRSFRRSLLVHAERAEGMLDQPEGGAFTRMHFAADLTAQTGPTGQRQYRAPHGVIDSQDASMLALMEGLAQAWPQSLPFDALVDIVRPLAPQTPADGLATLVIGHLVALVQANALHYRLEPAPYQAAQPKPQLIPGAFIGLAVGVGIPPGGQRVAHQGAQFGRAAFAVDLAGRVAIQGIGGRGDGVMPQVVHADLASRLGYLL